MAMKLFSALQGAVAPMLVALLAGTCFPSQAAADGEFIPDGGFELGIVGLDITRYPEYPTSGQPTEAPTRITDGALDGVYSLRLPGLRAGGYMLTYKSFRLVPGKSYHFRGTVASRGAATVRLQVFAAGWHSVARRHFKITRRSEKVSVDFRAAGNPRTRNGAVVHMVRLVISSRAAVLLDDVHLTGPTVGDMHLTVPQAAVSTNRVMGVYGIREDGVARVAFRPTPGRTYRLEITNPFTGNVLKSRTLHAPPNKAGVAETRVPLSTDHRGFYWIWVQWSDDAAHVTGRIRRAYVVITPSAIPAEQRRFFGLCVEEEGQHTTTSAFASPEKLYRLAGSMGAGAVRLFALAMPSHVTDDGTHYDFHQLDAALTALEAAHLQPFVELGSNVLRRLPAWLRKTRPGSSTIDLLAGLRGKKNRERIEALPDGHYLDLDAYRKYLSRVLGHLRGRVSYYELWNEPGYKFTVPAILRLAKLTHAVKQRVAPNAELIGYSSTIGPEDRDRGVDAKNLPSFLNAVASRDGLQYINILSYHGAHAFLVMRRGYDERNLQTGFVGRLRQVLAKHNASPTPIWDTERGISWASPHAGRVDFYEGTSRSSNPHFSTDAPNVLDVARQLPMVYATAAADGVQRVFWFNLDNSISQTAFSQRRWAMFDGQLEPMPQIPAYNAMTHFLAGRSFVRRVERDGGLRAFVFSGRTKTVVLAYNWKQNKTKLTIGHSARLAGFNLMGNPIPIKGSTSKSTTVAIDGWPRYFEVAGPASAVHIQ